MPASVCAQLHAASPQEEHTQQLATQPSPAPRTGNAKKTNQQGDIQVELLTCSPGDLIYELYGHTALRITTPDDDLVYNFGVFDETQSHFVWRFMLGKTDYMVLPCPYYLFEQSYIDRGSSITSLRINFTQEEAQRLLEMMKDRSSKEKRTYRYNFFSNNCTTNTRDVIEAVIDGTIVYAPLAKERKLTTRESLHEYTAGSPWAELGNDLLIGAACDTILSDRSAQFLPFHLFDAFQNATIVGFGNNGVEERREPLVAGEPVVLLEARDVPHGAGFPVTPLVCSLIFLAVLLGIFALEYWLKRIFWIFDMLLMPGIGLCGLLVTFMTLFSDHPTVSSNWQVWIYNPLPLLCMPWVVVCAYRRKRCAYHYLNAGLLLSFLIASPWIPQHFAVITLPLAVALLTRPASYIINFPRLSQGKRKGKKK
ncbi:MAG: DUF4105 domain-containing protein [Bacteroidales bacterium]|nr:DUF4105 domain-containing protein [Candidatus Physcousia equi]